MAIYAMHKKTPRTSLELPARRGFDLAAPLGCRPRGTMAIVLTCGFGNAGGRRMVV